MKQKFSSVQSRTLKEKKEKRRDEMNCFRPRRTKTSPSAKLPSYGELAPPPPLCAENSGPRNMIEPASELYPLGTYPINPELNNQKHLVLLQIPGCTLYLIETGEAVELARGDFKFIRLSENDVLLANIIQIGDDLLWPLTKDEPVVKVDSHHYLFSLLMDQKDGEPLSYGVSFSGESGGSLSSLDSLLKEHCCFSISSSSTEDRGLDWREFAPRIEAYNGVLAKAIAEGTGQIVKGIFMCSNLYAKQVNKGGETILSRHGEKRYGVPATASFNSRNLAAPNKTMLNKSLKRARKLSKMTEKLSKSMLDGVCGASGAIMAPVVQSKAGKKFLAMVPGEVLLASLDAVNQVLDALEAAEKQAFTATSGAATRMVSNRFGESAGETTDHVLATAGNFASTAWNISKIRKVMTPKSSVSSGIKNAAKNRKV
ncbi:senescence/dehydration-associated protein At4g35985, chloroplastic-like [Malania oleifera]|uniref:senescence/dehydration-associated protein At4g35985, chloroplastic-like n=1 Tax=Malania oleifera TaxID=397392 RepID=UPI0025AE7D51|nr:senescence/dehydration-associated protein At4g35985, chloroplastic-like [Malania oleifera]